MKDNINGREAASTATPAATLVIFRDKIGSPPDILLVERAAHMAFAGGAIVFPGGRVDPDDHAIVTAGALLTGGSDDPDDSAARVAAIRETLEESGIAIGFVTEPAAEWIISARARLAKAEPFSAMLAEADAQLDLDILIPFSRWRPNFKEARTFDTRFYIARARSDMPEPIVDETENVHSYWSSAAAVLTAADEGKVRVIFPTRRNLERLAQFEDFDAAKAQAEAISPDLICPFVEERDGVSFLCIPPDRGYPVTAEPLSAMVRG
jgi:8-oxo-dGTP pyrophosphatase MutT (NUDIX family)